MPTAEEMLKIMKAKKKPADSVEEVSKAANPNSVKEAEKTIDEKMLEVLESINNGIAELRRILIGDPKA